MAENFHFYDLKPITSSNQDDIMHSLKSEKKYLSPKYFYDKKGSELFTQICELDEYYPTRTEMCILKDNIEDIRSSLGEKPMIIEFGSGASEKIQLILSSIEKRSSYMAIDISKQFLIESSKKVALLYPDINVYALCADYSSTIKLPDFCKLRENKVFYFSGSSFGNFNAEQQKTFLSNARGQLNIGESFLIGVDLIKDVDVLHAAYNDKKGITAEFNLNILSNLNTIGNGDFDLKKFKHYAFFNKEQSRIEMHLKSTENQIVRLFEEDIYFHIDELIHTENSYKFEPTKLKKSFEEYGFKFEKLWTDNKRYFGLFYFRAV